MCVSGIKEAKVKIRNIVLGALSFVFAALLLVILMAGVLRAQAAPLAIVTPVTNPGARISASAVRYPVKFLEDEVITADGRGTIYSLPDYNILDMQYVIDQGATPNTTTLTIQYSCDGVNWVDGANLVASNVADATNISQLNNYCRYTAIYANVANTETITVTVIGVAK